MCQAVLAASGSKPSSSFLDVRTNASRTLLIAQVILSLGFPPTCHIVLTTECPCTTVEPPFTRLQVGRHGSVLDGQHHLSECEHSLAGGGCSWLLARDDDDPGKSVFCHGSDAEYRKSWSHGTWRPMEVRGVWLVHMAGASKWSPG